MKKPKITEGEWFYDGYSAVINNSNETISECAFDDHNKIDSFKPQEKNANAKAISAVPEMIEALIDILDQLNDETNNYLQVDSDSIDKIIEALTKAGVEL